MSRKNDSFWAWKAVGRKNWTYADKSASAHATTELSIDSKSVWNSDLEKYKFIYSCTVKSTKWTKKEEGKSFGSTHLSTLGWQNGNLRNVSGSVDPSTFPDSKWPAESESMPKFTVGWTYPELWGWLRVKKLNFLKIFFELLNPNDYESWLYRHRLYTHSN